MADLLSHSPPIHHPQSFLTHQAYSSPRRRINFIKVGDNIVLVENAIQNDEHDLEEECEERSDLGEGVGSFNMWVDDSFIEEHKTLKVGVRDVLKLKEVANDQHHIVFI